MRQENAENTTETFTAGNYAKIGERGWGQHQTFVRRHSAIRLKKTCLTLFLQVIATPPNPISPYENRVVHSTQPSFIIVPTLRFTTYTPCFHHIHQSIATIRSTFRRRSAKQCEYGSAVSPRCLEPQEAHHSMNDHLFFCGAASA